MNRPIPHTAVATALFALLAVAGCKKPTESTTATPASEPVSMPPASEPAPATPPATPAAAALTVTTLDLGTSIGADNHIAAPTTHFGRRDSIHAAVASDGPGGTLTAKWTMGDQLVTTQDKTVAAGPQMTEFSISKPDGWPAGHYRIQVSSGGNVLQSRDFDVQ